MERFACTMRTTIHLTYVVSISSSVRSKSGGAENTYKLSALVLCDGNVLNEDFDLYLSAVSQREKEIGLGTYGNGANRHKPMFIFANPLGIPELDNAATLIHPDPTLAEYETGLRIAYQLIRTAKGGERVFYCYRLAADIGTSHSITDLKDQWERTEQEAKSPIDIDIIIVGRKLALIEPSPEVPVGLFSECVEETSEIVEAFNRSNRRLSRSDITVIMMARLRTTLSRVRDLEKILSYAGSIEKDMDVVVEGIWKQQNPRDAFLEERQMRLF